jgi:hypothetical protein
MLFPLWSSVIHLKDICLKVFLVAGLIRAAAWILCVLFVQFVRMSCTVIISVVMYAQLVCRFFHAARLIMLLSALCV